MGRIVHGVLLGRILSNAFRNILSLGLIVTGQIPILAASDQAFSIPVNIHVSADLQPRFIAMLAASLTFRSQCQRLADQSDLYVRFIVDARLADGPFRAQSVISHLHSGAMVAFVSIGAMQDPTEWLAHEIEHVIEQLEGVKLHERAAAKRNVWRTSWNAYETDRALQTGKAVLGEVRAAERLRTRVATSDAAPTAVLSAASRSNTRGEVSPVAPGRRP